MESRCGPCTYPQSHTRALSDISNVGAPHRTDVMCPRAHTHSTACARSRTSAISSSRRSSSKSKSVAVVCAEAFIGVPANLQRSHDTRSQDNQPRFAARRHACACSRQRSPRGHSQAQRQRRRRHQLFAGAPQALRLRRHRERRAPVLAERDASLAVAAAGQVEAQTEGRAGSTMTRAQHTDAGRTPAVAPRAARRRARSDLAWCPARGQGRAHARAAEASAVRKTRHRAQAGARGARAPGAQGARGARSAQRPSAPQRPRPGPHTAPAPRA